MQAGPQPRAQSATSLFVVAAITVAISCCPFTGGVIVLRQALQPVHAVTPAALMDAAATPGGGFVTLTLTPDVGPLAHIAGSGGGGGAYLLGAHEDPRLVLYVPDTCDLGRAIGAYQPLSAPAQPEALASATRPWSVRGRIWNAGDYSRLSSSMEGDLVDEQITAVYGAHHDGVVRVLEVDATPSDLYFPGAGPIGCCAFPLLLLALFAVFRGVRALTRGGG